MNAHGERILQEVEKNSDDLTATFFRSSLRVFVPLWLMTDETALTTKTQRETTEQIKQRRCDRILSGERWGARGRLPARAAVGLCSGNGL